MGCDLDSMDLKRAILAEIDRELAKQSTRLDHAAALRWIAAKIRKGLDAG